MARIELHTPFPVSSIQKLIVLMIRECCYNFKKTAMYTLHFSQLSHTLVSLEKTAYKNKKDNKQGDHSDER